MKEETSNATFMTSYGRVRFVRYWGIYLIRLCVNLSLPADLTIGDIELSSTTVPIVKLRIIFEFSLSGLFVYLLSVG